MNEVWRSVCTFALCCCLVMPSFALSPLSQLDLRLPSPGQEAIFKMLKVQLESLKVDDPELVVELYTEFINRSLESGRMNQALGILENFLLYLQDSDFDFDFRPIEILKNFLQKLPYSLPPQEQQRLQDMLFKMKEPSLNLELIKHYLHYHEIRLGFEMVGKIYEQLQNHYSFPPRPEGEKLSFFKESYLDPMLDLFHLVKSLELPADTLLVDNQKKWLEIAKNQLIKDIGRFLHSCEAALQKISQNQANAPQRENTVDEKLLLGHEDHLLAVYENALRTLRQESYPFDALRIYDHSLAEQGQAYFVELLEDLGHLDEALFFDSEVLDKFENVKNSFEDWIAQLNPPKPLFGDNNPIDEMDAQVIEERLLKMGEAVSKSIEKAIHLNLEIEHLKSLIDMNRFLSRSEITKNLYLANKVNLAQKIQNSKLLPKDQQDMITRLFKDFLNKDMRQRYVVPNQGTFDRLGIKGVEKRYQLMKEVSLILYAWEYRQEAQDILSDISLVDIRARAYLQLADKFFPEGRQHLRDDLAMEGQLSAPHLLRMAMELVFEPFVNDKNKLIFLWTQDDRNRKPQIENIQFLIFNHLMGYYVHSRGEDSFYREQIEQIMRYWENELQVKLKEGSPDQVRIMFAKHSLERLRSYKPFLEVTRLSEEQINLLHNFIENDLANVMYYLVNFNGRGLQSEQYENKPLPWEESYKDILPFLVLLEHDSDIKTLVDTYNFQIYSDLPYILGAYFKMEKLDQIQAILRILENQLQGEVGEDFTRNEKHFQSLKVYVISNFITGGVMDNYNLEDILFHMLWWQRGSQKAKKGYTKWMKMDSHKRLQEFQKFLKTTAKPQKASDISQST